MARSRIVLETSDERKSALVKNLDLQGGSLSDWFEEQVITSVPGVTKTLSEDLSPFSCPDALEIGSALSSLKSQDWAFTDDDTRYLTHDLHPYPAKFIPQIPANLISRLSLKGDIVFDPFGGSATTAVEAVRLGRRAISIDANPLSAIIGRVKTGFLSADARSELEQLVAAVESHVIGSEAQRPGWADALIERYKNQIPDIPNIEKWFSNNAIGELSLLRFLIEEITSGLSTDAALLALSRIIMRVSYQESETRYVAVPKNVSSTLTLRGFLESLKTIMRRLSSSTAELQCADAKFFVRDSRQNLPPTIGENSVDLIVTSPPYPNATDYHLYHRFRLFWLGYDPRNLGQIEIGSHLRHQRNETGFEEYLDDMRKVLSGCAQVLQPGRYAVFVVGDALFKGEIFSTQEAISESAQRAGFLVAGSIDRVIHQTKRSFAKPGRRARTEQIVILQKPNRTISVTLNPPAYRMWKFEENLRCREIARLTDRFVDARQGARPITLELAQPALWNIRRLTFTKDFSLSDDNKNLQPTWQKVLENGDSEAGRRKDPKYATHGLHPFKGKFYPQLAKSLLNISGARLGGVVLDPFCGSGTFVLEGMLNGFAAHGCDLNPLAAKIARAKTSALSIPRDVADLSMRSLIERLTRKQIAPAPSLDQFSTETHTELLSWFPKPVLYKLNWLLGQVRLFGNSELVEFFEILISSLIREISHQDPTDLRIRRRKSPLRDAPVFELFRERLEAQHIRLLKYWAVAGRQPGNLVPPKVIHGDSRKAETIAALGLFAESVDCIVTSPPYATALPYIDTDRLSLLSIMGMRSSIRSEFEERLIGSREIKKSARHQLERLLNDYGASKELPEIVVRAITKIHKANAGSDVGFRKANMAALLWRYFIDMRDSLSQAAFMLKRNALAFYVVGDSRTNAGGQWVAIETCKHITAIGEMIGLKHVESIPIGVTTENYKHIKNAITENKVIIFEKP